MREGHEYKGVDYEIELSESKGRWDWSADVLDQRLNLKESRARTEETARREINRALGQRTYKRLSDGLTFTYVVDYWLEPEDRANWSSRVYFEGDLVGTPDGRAAKVNNVRGQALYEMFCHITEQNIEQRVGVGR